MSGGLEAHVCLHRGALALDAELHADDADVVAICGPNGAGKTSLIRALAGLEAVERGRVVLDGTVLEDAATGAYVPPERRRAAVVFQENLLLPNLSVLDNVAFGLRCRGTSRSGARQAAAAWLDRVGLSAAADARPAALSGGQARRVALARALAVEPRLLLLDEPLAALDAATRVEVRRELRRHLDAQRGVRVLVTHDPVDALTLARRIVVLEAGQVVQAGTSDEVSRRPRSRYVAEMVGLNLYRGVAAGSGLVLPGGHELIATPPDVPITGAAIAVIHPRAVALHRVEPEGSPRNVWTGRVEGLEVLGDRVRVWLAGPIPVVAEITPAAAAALGLSDAAQVYASVKASEIVLYAS